MSADLSSAIEDKAQKQNHSRLLAARTTDALAESEVDELYVAATAGLRRGEWEISLSPRPTLERLLT